MDFSTRILSTQGELVGQAREVGKARSLERSADSAREGLDKEALKKACRGFEEVFLRQILKNMRKMATGFGGEKLMAGQNLYWDLMDGAFATELAQSDTLGIGRFVYESLVNQMEMTDKHGTPAQETPKTDLKA